MSVPASGGCSDEENGSITTSIFGVSALHAAGSRNGLATSARDFGSAAGATGSKMSLVCIEPETSTNTASIGLLSGLKICRHSGWFKVMPMPTAIKTRSPSSQPMAGRKPLRCQAVHESPAITPTKRSATAKDAGVPLKTRDSLAGFI